MLYTAGVGREGSGVALKECVALYLESCWKGERVACVVQRQSHIYGIHALQYVPLCCATISTNTRTLLVGSPWIKYWIVSVCLTMLKSARVRVLCIYGALAH